MSSPYPYQDCFCSFLLEVGAYARKQQAHCKTSFKAGQQAVTDVDLEVSRRARIAFAPILEQKGFVLVDEESIDKAGTPDQVFADYDDLIILDPIDGTAGYAMGRGYWGINLAHWHRGKPVWGGFYLPAQRTLIFTQDGKAMCRTEIGTEDDATAALQARPIEITSQTFIDVFRSNHLGANQDPLHQKAWFNTPESAVQSAAVVLQGQSAATVVVTANSIWDIAPLAALTGQAGLGLYDLATGQDVRDFSAANFKADWKLPLPLLVCHPHNLQAVRALFAGDLF